MTRKLRMTSAKLQIAGRDTVVRVHVAESFWSRARGLLGRDRLEANEALWIKPCNSVHTFGMSYPIDVLFLDHDQRVVQITRRLRSMRVAAARRAHTTIEMLGGVVDDLGIKEGMCLRVVE